MIGLAGYLYFRGEDDTAKMITTAEQNTTTQVILQKTSEENTTISSKKTTETTAKTDSQATTEQRQELPDDYVWDTERLGEPPQIVYDFAENQERFDYIVEKVDSVVGKGDGFSTGLKYKGIYYNSKYEGIEDKLPSKFEKKAKYIFDNTPFYKLSKEVGGDWIMYYNQEEDRDRFIFIMSYIPGMTDEQAY